MGDEIGLGDDHEWEHDPARAADNRWLHRPAMDWQAAERRHDPASVEGRVFAGLQRVLRARRGNRALHGAGRVEPIWSGNPHVLAYVREHRGERLLALANFSEAEQGVPADVVRGGGFDVETRRAFGPKHAPPRREGDVLVLEPHGWVWLGPPPA